MRAIPTTYAGVNFRSRLEARWAAFFDLLGWSWEYEPIDLAGYIPDFILNFKQPLLVEVKPLLWRWDDPRRPEIDDVRHKIDSSGWTGHSALLGAQFRSTKRCMWIIGLARLGPNALGFERERGQWTSFGGSTQEWFWPNDEHCKTTVSFFYGYAYEAAHLPPEAETNDLELCWREAGNRVQWRPR